MAAQTEYLNRIQSYDDSVVERVKIAAQRGHGRGRPAGRRRAPRSKSARDAIAANEREVAAARAEAESRFAELKSAQAQRREAMEALESREQALSNNLASISNQIASEGGPAPTGEVPAPLTPARPRRLHQRKRSQRPGLGAGGGPGGDLRRQLDRHHPLHLGRRPRLLRILRLRLLRRGQLRPARRRLPRKPARLDRPGDLGRTRPGQVDHRLRQRRTRLDDDRRPRLRHRRRPRPALALLAGRLARRLHRPPPARLLGLTRL